MKVEIKPGTEEKMATVYIGGHQVGEMWLTVRGACYSHTNRAVVISRENMQTLVAAMQAAEVLGMKPAQ